MNYYLRAITKNYVNFKGRARRKEYWMFILFNMIVGIIFALIGAIAQLDILPQLYTMAVFLPSLGLTVRRLHDVGKSWTWLFIALIPVIGGIWLIILTCKEGMPGQNQYGVNPKGRAN